MTSPRARLVCAFPRSGLPLLIGAIALVASGCEDLIDVESEDQRIAVGSTTGPVCPDAATNAGSAEVIATVFASDGTLVSGIEVSFETSRGMLSSSTATSNSSGQASVTVTGSRTADLEPVVVTGFHPDGEMDDVSIPWPLTPALCVSVSPFVDPSMGSPPGCFVSGNSIVLEVGQKVDIVTSVLLPCNISRIMLSLDYDPASIEFDSSMKGGTLEVGPPPDMDVQETDFSVIVDEMTGRVDVDYRQVGPPLLGTNVANAPYLVLTFTALAPTPVVDGVNIGAGVEIASYQLFDDDGVSYPLTSDDPLPPFVIVAEPPP